MGETDDFEPNDVDEVEGTKLPPPLHRYFQFHLSASGRRVRVSSGEQQTEFHFSLTIGILGGIAGLAAIWSLAG